MSERRIAICNVCPFLSTNRVGYTNKLRSDEHCTLCGCPKVQKSKSPKAQCPDKPPRWERELLEKELDQLHKDLE